MASHRFDCVVDTTELAESVHTVNKHIDGTTGAVVGMKMAVIAAEQEGADHVCKNVNRGFYSLIHSQISQKMAALQSEVDAKLLRLNQQKKQLLGIRRRMERDYQMICARYNKLFTSINRNLKQRVVELDRPVINLVQTDTSKISNRLNLLMADVPLGQAESIKLSQRIASSNLKNNAMRSISSITNFIADSNRLDSIVNTILLKKRIEEPKESMLVPVAIIESNYDASDNRVLQTYVSEIGLSANADAQIGNGVQAAIRNEEIKWSDEAGKNPELENQFRQAVANSGLDERVKNQMLQMFTNSSFQGL